MEQLKKESTLQSEEINNLNKYSNEVLSSKKKILSYLIDYFMVIIFTVIINLISINFILNNIPSVKENNSNFYTQYEINEKVIEDSYLNDFNSNNYLMMLVRSSLDESNFPGTDFSKVLPLSKENDLFYLYYFKYKNSNLDLYKNNDNYNPSLYYETLNKSNYFIFSNDYYMLKEDVALKVGDNIFNKSSSNETLKSEVLNIINNIYNEATNDLKANNTTYINSLNLLEKSANLTKNYNLINLSISYLIGYLIYFLLLPFINKNHKTVSMIIFKSYKEYKFKSTTLSLVLLNIVRFIIFYSSILISGYLSLGDSMTLILFNDFNNIYYLLFIILFTLLLYIFSLLISLIKPLNQNFEDKISGIIYKDETKVIINAK